MSTTFLTKPFELFRNGIVATLVVSRRMNRKVTLDATPVNRGGFSASHNENFKRKAKAF